MALVPLLLQGIAIYGRKARGLAMVTKSVWWLPYSSDVSAGAWAPRLSLSALSALLNME
jgi:hypothetical protein